MEDVRESFLVPKSCGNAICLPFEIDPFMRSYLAICV